MGRGRNQAGIGQRVGGVGQRIHILVQVGLLLGQAEGDPLGKHLGVAMDQRPVGIAPANQLIQSRMRIPAGAWVAQLSQVRKAPEDGRNPRQNLAPGSRSGTPGRFRICSEVSQLNLPFWFI
jgi:hypothetical protein